MLAQFGLFIDYCDDLRLENPMELQECQHNMAPFSMWLLIEVVSFYLYMIEVFLYVSSHQLQQEIDGATIQDIRKEVTDFIEYSEDQLNWFTFDFQLLTIPLVLVYCVYTTDQRANRRYTLNSYYGSSMVLLWLMHFFSYLINRKSFNKKFYDERKVKDIKSPGIEHQIYRPVME